VSSDAWGHLGEAAPSTALGGPPPPLRRGGAELTCLPDDRLAAAGVGDRAEMRRRVVAEIEIRNGVEIATDEADVGEFGVGHLAEAVEIAAVLQGAQERAAYAIRNTKAGRVVRAACTVVIVILLPCEVGPAPCRQVTGSLRALRALLMR
jgi:hypothetical protein